MKNRITALFESKQSGICSIFITAGYPEKESLLSIVPTLEASGVDLIEIGIPFSDPLADGDTIQMASARALRNGANMELIFRQIKQLRKTSAIPIVLMGYYNPILKYGLDHFLNQCNLSGVDGLIIPDLPFDLYKSHFKNKFEEFDVPLIFLITTKTNSERTKMIDKESKSFIYLVSSSSVTGKAEAFTESQIQEFKAIKELKINSPLLLGFGIHDSKTFDTACEYFNGAIIGSAFIRHLKNGRTAGEFIKLIKEPDQVATTIP